MEFSKQLHITDLYFQGIMPFEKQFKEEPPHIHIYPLNILIELIILIEPPKLMRNTPNLIINLYRKLEASRIILLKSHFYNL